MIKWGFWVLSWTNIDGFCSNTGHFKGKMGSQGSWVKGSRAQALWGLGSGRLERGLGLCNPYFWTPSILYNSSRRGRLEFNDNSRVFNVQGHSFRQTKTFVDFVLHFKRKCVSVHNNPVCFNSCVKRAHDGISRESKRSLLFIQNALFYTVALSDIVTMKEGKNA